MGPGEGRKEEFCKVFASQCYRNCDGNCEGNCWDKLKVGVDAKLTERMDCFD